MYAEYWNLDKKPFENDQDMAFFFEESRHHKEAHVRLLYAAEQHKPLALLIGESGIGKTYVCRSAAAELDKRGYLTARLSGSGIDGRKLRECVAEAFGIGVENLRDVLTQQHKKKKFPVLFIDNAECFDARHFEELRVFLDWSSADGKPLMTIILVGHPRLRGTLKRKHSLLQRLEVGYELEPLEEEEAKAYLLHRLTVAGAPEHLLDDEAQARLVQAGNGFPRLLNRVGDLALLMGMIDKLDHVTAEVADRAEQEMKDLKKTGSGRGGRSDEGDEDDGDEDRGGRGRGRSRGRDRERSGRGRGRDRDRDREDRDGGRGRGRRRRGRGRDRDEEGGRGRGRRERSSEPAAEETGDESGESYGFNAEEYKDIESMTEIIQGSLKVKPSSGRRRRKSSGGRAERGDPLHYFDSNTDEKDDDDVESTDDGEENEGGGRRRRGRRRRRRGKKDSGREDAVQDDADDSNDSNDSSDDAPEADASDEVEVVEKKPARKPRKPKAPEPKAEVEDTFDASGLDGSEEKEAVPTAKGPSEDGFAAGLLDEDA